MRHSIPFFLPSFFLINIPSQPRISCSRACSGRLHFHKCVGYTFGFTFIHFVFGSTWPQPSIGKSWNIHKATIFSAVCKWKLNTISVLDIVVEEVLWKRCPIGILLSSVLSLALLCFWTDSCQIESCQGLSTYLTQGITDKDRFKQSKWMVAHYLLSNLHSGHAVGSPFSGRKETKTRKNVLSLRMQSIELNSIDP